MASVRKRHGAARPGQTMFVVVDAAGTPTMHTDSDKVRAYSARAIKSAATQAFRAFMRRDGARAAAKALWTRGKHKPLDEDPLVQRQRVQLHDTLQVLRKSMIARVRSDKSCKEASSVTRMVAAAFRTLPTTSAARRIVVRGNPLHLTVKELNAVLKHSCEAFEARFDAPLGDAETDPRYFFRHFMVVRMAPEATPTDKTAFLCSMNRNVRPSAMELLHAIVYKSHLLVLPAHVADHWVHSQPRSSEERAAAVAVSAKKTGVMKKRFNTMAMGGDNNASSGAMT
jgi:hypothetical protein